MPGLSATPCATMPGIAQFGDDAIRQIARALARATGEQHDVGKLERVLQPFPQRGHVVVRDPQPFRLAAELAHGIGEHLGVRVVDLCRLHRLAGRDDLVAGREDGDDRLSPDVDGGDADRGQHAGIAAGQQLTAAEHGLAGGDVGSGKRHAAARRDGSGDSQLAAVGLGVLDHHHGIGAARNHPAGGNRHGRARPNHGRRHDAGVNRFLAKLHACAALPRTRRTCLRRRRRSHRRSSGRTTARRPARRRRPPARGRARRRAARSRRRAA